MPFLRLLKSVQILSFPHTMLRKSTLFLLGCLVLFTGCQRGNDAGSDSPEPLSGTYELVSNESMVSFASIKKTEDKDVSVPGTFDDLNGQISVDEQTPLNKTTGQINVKLASLDTGVDERDKNILTYFFRAMGDNIVSETLRFEIGKMQFGKDVSSPMPVGKPTPLTAIGKLSAYDVTKSQKTKLTVTRLGSDRFMVSTREPLVFEIDKFDMVEPLNKMMEVCGHVGISNVVPAQFYLVFEKKQNQSA